MRYVEGIDRGDVIEYQPFMGSPRTVVVTNHEDDIKNGRPGFDGVVLEGDELGLTVWGYDEQVTYRIRPADEDELAWADGAE